MKPHRNKYADGCSIYENARETGDWKSGVQKLQRLNYPALQSRIEMLHRLIREEAYPNAEPVKRKTAEIQATIEKYGKRNMKYLGDASPLSARAKKLYQRILDGKFYPAFDEKTPKAMQELLDLELVATIGRPVKIVRCFVPSRGYTPFKMEKFG